jgi:hypothetical protein
MIPILLFPDFTLKAMFFCVFVAALHFLALVVDSLVDLYWYGRRRHDLGLTHDQYMDWVAVERAYGATTDDELEALFAEWKAAR